MDFEDLLDFLDIETPADFVYFEQFADLIETPREISVDAIIALSEESEDGVISELAENYFDDLLKSVPDGEDELYSLLANIGTTLSSLAESTDGDAARAFAEELYKFRAWYLYDSRVICSDPENGTDREIPLIEALTNCRAQSFTDEDYEYDFSETSDYPLEEYIVSLNTLLEDDYGDGDTYGEDEDYRDLEDED